MENSEGRWFSFSIKNDSHVILEKKGLPDHLSKIENLDISVTVDSILHDLQDAGEVSRLSF